MRRLKATEVLEWPLMALGSELPFLINERLVSPMMSIEKLMCYISLFGTKLSGSPNKVDGIAKQRETSIELQPTQAVIDVTLRCMFTCFFTMEIFFFFSLFIYSLSEK